MEITVITGSPRKNGTSAVLVDEFIKGAEEAGHSVYRFDAAFKKISPCIGCEACGFGERDCIQKDDMQELYPHLWSSDVIVFATPVYYYTFSAQIKTAIDRLCSMFSKLAQTNKKAILLATAADTNLSVMDSLLSTYEKIIQGWTDGGKVLAINAMERADIENSEYPRQAYLLGKSL